MKKLSLILLIGVVMLLFEVSVQANGGLLPEEKEKINKQKSICPKTLINNQDKCFTCHIIPDWGIKEADPERYFKYPNSNMKIQSGVAIYKFIAPNAQEFKEMLTYLNRHNINYLIMEISSSGGNMFDAWQMISLMDEWKGTIRTECRDFAASAACLIFMNGTPGFRLISKTAVIMWHELGYLKMLEWVTPSSSEDEANLNRMLQDIQHDYMAKKCKLTKEELNVRVKRKEFWLTPNQAIEFGFADGFIIK